MRYAPHKLQKLESDELVVDEYGRPQTDSTETWSDICACRCDEDGETTLINDNGDFYKSSYHVVCASNTIDIHNGDTVRCLLSDGTVRGQGIVRNAKRLNRLKYAEFWT
jgi:hypothetical protein